jgi:hypothetical protein
MKESHRKESTAHPDPESCGIPAPPEFFLLIGVAMVGILAHAKFDLPFQIYSIHSQFVLLCAVLTSLLRPA